MSASRPRSGSAAASPHRRGVRRVSRAGAVVVREEPGRVQRALVLAASHMKHDGVLQRVGGLRLSGLQPRVETMISMSVKPRVRVCITRSPSG